MIRIDKNRNPHDIALAQKIDQNLSLISPSVIVALAMFASFVFSYQIINYTNNLTKSLL